jgi:hypothetical protein
MMKTVKHSFTSIGEHGGELARTIGSAMGRPAWRTASARGAH